MRHNRENVIIFIALLLVISIISTFCVLQAQVNRSIIIAALDEKISTCTDKIVDEIRIEKVEVEKPIEDIISEPTSTTSEEIISNAPNSIEGTKFKIGESVPLPSLPTNVKLCTDYRSYNLWYTPHYRLQQAAYTDENGLRRYNDDYIVGLGKFYSETIGDRFKITLDTGSEFTVILGDGKTPIDCDENNMYTPCKDYNGNDCANVLEFIMDSDVMSDKVYAYGSIDCLDEFSGNVVRMEYLGRDTSADWDTYETR